MEVATALLEASRKMSGSGESGGSSCSATASWSSSASEVCNSSILTYKGLDLRKDL